MALKELSTNEKLDAVLRYLNDEYSKTFVKVDKDGSVEHGKPIKKGYLKTELEISLGISFREQAENIDELKLILEYLCEVEHYISKEKENSEDNYRILYAGKVFIEADGYTEQKRLLTEKQEWDKKMTEKTIENSTVLNNLTSGLICAGWAAAGGTAFLGLMELIKLIPFQWLFGCHHCH